MIVSFFEGRVRIRREELKDPSTMDLVMGFIRSQDGIVDTVPNPATGSLLITYDPEKIPTETLLAAAETLEKQLAPAKKKGGRKKSKKGSALSPLAESGLLGVLCGLTVLTGFTNKRAHIIGALLFTGLAAAHVYTRRKRLY